MKQALSDFSKSLFAMPPSHVAVKQLFSALKFVLHGQRTSMKDKL